MQKEPKSNDELRYTYGISRLYAVKKGPDSVQFGEEWLNDLEAIVIDPLRTPNIAREFENIDYAVDRDGNILPRLVDKDNHTITKASVVYKSGEFSGRLSA